MQLPRMYFLRYFIGLVNHDHIPTEAAALAFKTILGLIPALLVVVGVFAMTPGAADLQNQLQDFSADHLMPVFTDVISDTVASLMKHAGRITSTGLITLAILTLWLLRTVDLAFNRIWGVGHKTAGHMHRMGIFTGADLRRVSLQHLVQEFGKMGRVFYDFARGIDERPVVAAWERKSVSCETTFDEDIYKSPAIIIELYHRVEELLRRLQKSGFEGHTLTLKVKFGDFQQITRSVTASEALLTKEQILPLAKQLVRSVDISREHPVRLLGLGISRAAADVTADDTASGPEWKELELEFEPWPDD